MPAPVSSTTASRSDSSASFQIWVTVLFLGTIGFALLLLPRASSFAPPSHTHPHTHRTRGFQLFQATATAAVDEGTSTSTSKQLMEEQAGGNNSNRRRRKQRMRNSDARTNSDNNNNYGIDPASVSPNARKEDTLPEPLVPFASVESVRLVNISGDDDDGEVRVELGLRNDESNGSSARPSKVVIDPRDLHQTSDFELWMALRKNVVDVSASQLSVVLGTNYFTSREKLLQDKVRARTDAGAAATANDADDDGDDNIDDADSDGDAIFLAEEEEESYNNNGGGGGGRSNSKACAWGIKMEPLAFAQYSAVVTAANDNDDNDEGPAKPQSLVEETGMHLLRHTDPVTQKTYVFGASPDGMVTEHKHKSKSSSSYDGAETKAETETETEPSVGLLEIKSLWGRRNKGSLPEFHNCPSRFYDQIQGQMAICDRDWCDLMLFIPPSGGGTSGSGGKKSKRKGKSAKKRKKQAAATAAAAAKTRKNRGRNYCIVRVKRNESYWNDKVLPELIRFCDEVEERAAAAAAAGNPEDENANGDGDAAAVVVVVVEATAESESEPVAA